MPDDDNTMRLAAGVGIVPSHLRNQAYSKLEFGPGEGGLAAPSAPKPKSEAGDMDGFLAAVAAGADPVKLAEKLRGTSTPSRKRGPA